MDDGIGSLVKWILICLMSFFWVGVAVYFLYFMGVFSCSTVGGE